MSLRFLDTNVLLRYFTRDNEEKADRALALLLRIGRREEEVGTSLPVLFETAYTLQRFYRVPRGQIRDLLVEITDLGGIHLPGKELFRDALDLFARTNVSLADAYSVVYMRTNRMSEIYSWDTDFDHFDGCTRVEPPPSS
jgi:uncharacterized protein